MKQFVERVFTVFPFGYDQSRAEFILVASAVLVGLLTATGAIVFVEMLEQMQGFSGMVHTRFGVLGVLLLMGLAGLLVGFMVDRWASEAKGHGVPEVMEALAVRSGRIRGRVAAVKVLASSITIGAGGSAGREGPIVQVGSALGSSLGRYLQLSDERVKTLVACGGAAGIAATFNAPIAGAIFAIEVILGRLTVRNFSAVVISAVTAGVVSQSYWGNQPAFHVPAYSLNSFVELPLYILLGLLAALVAVLFIRLLYRAESLFDHWPVPLAVRTAVGMMLTGSLVLVFPEREILGSGLHLIGETIAGDFSLPLQTMLLLLVAKLLATTFTLGAGNSGGVFAPSLFMGAVLGGIVGTLGQQVWPTVVQNPGAYAIVGMAAVFAGAARAPITAILIVFEMSGDYKLILPLMLATVLATIMAELLFSESIYTLKLKLKGINLHRGRDEDVLKSVTARDVMRPITHPVRATTSVAELLEIFGETHLHGLPVMDSDGYLSGLVTLHDIEESRHLPAGQLTVGDVATPYSKLVLAFPDDTVDVVLRSMRPRELGHIPVVAREQPRHLLGFLRREDILKAYELALVRRQSLQNQARALNLNYQPGMIVTDVIITPHSIVVGKRVQDIAPQLPEKCVLVSIQRRGNVIVPHGDTELQAGDTLTMFLDKAVADQTCLLFSTNQPTAMGETT